VAGLRDRKKATTSQAIVDAAMKLFAGRHFADVSIDEIAVASGIARRTFFRYFPTKEDVFLDPRRLDRDYAAVAMRARAPGEDDVALVIRVLAEIQRRGFSMFKPEHQVELHRLTHFEPELAARSWLLMEQVRDVLVAGLVSQRFSRSEQFRARILVSSCIMVVDSGITTWIEGGMQEDLGALLQEGAEYVRRGFGASAAGGRQRRPAR
jgi:AcrR family transcriptional regulator